MMVDTDEQYEGHLELVCFIIGIKNQNGHKTENILPLHTRLCIYQLYILFVERTISTGTNLNAREHRSKGIFCPGVDQATRLSRAKHRKQVSTLRVGRRFL